MVQPDPAIRDVWRVAAHPGHVLVIIAASEPVCPHCGAALAAAIGAERGRERPPAAERGRIFDVLRNLR
jgi:hypothetical protein